MTMRRILSSALVALFLLPCWAGAADQPGAQKSTFITLGTMGGPVSGANRSQPANVLLFGQDAYLVDVGDGAVQQLAKAGIRLGSVKALFISHLHFVHTGGIAAFLGLRYQTSVPGAVTIYGPPGTRRMIEGLTRSMLPAAEAGYGVRVATWVRPENTVKVVELSGGDKVVIGSFLLSAVQNSHYDFLPGSPEDKRFKSLSYRFDMADRSIVYTGDTGPSRDVEALAMGADLLVSEMVDVEGTLANIRRSDPNLSAQALSGIRYHLSAHHLSPEQVGTLAEASQVKQLVVTHFSGGTADPVAVQTYAPIIQAHFSGKVSLAKDLDRF